jgi:hypothetical protein
MSNFFRNAFRTAATVMLSAIALISTDCTYYKVKTDRKTPVPLQVEKAAESAGVAIAINKIRKRSEVVVAMKKGNVVTGDFRFQDSAYVYLGPHNPPRAILKSDINYIKVSSNEKYLILHSGAQAWHLKYAVLSDDKTNLSGKVEEVSSNHKYYLKAKGNRRYKSKEGDPTQEIHLYAPVIVPASDSSVVVPLSMINRVELYKTDTGAEIGTFVLGIVGVTAVVTVVIALTKSSCPFIYTETNNSFEFAGEAYGGAIYPSLERDDYMPLPGFTAKNGKYGIRIANELLEKQYTNLAELIIAVTPDDSQVLIDKYGTPYTYSSPQEPVQALSYPGYDVKKALLAKDRTSWLFDEGNGDDREASDLYLTFTRPRGTTQGKLLLRAQNSLWLDYVYGKFNEQFGSSYEELVEAQKKEPASKLNAWSREQEIPLSVSLLTPTGWREVDVFNVIGPLASRDLIMPINLDGIDSDSVQLRLRTGLMFWEIDYAAMDFTNNRTVEIIKIHPDSALDELGKNVLSEVRDADSKYLAQTEVGNVVTLSYPSPNTKGKRSIFLHSRGYYEYIRNYKNDINWFKVWSFKNKRGFTRFAREQYDELSESKELFQISAN